MKSCTTESLKHRLLFLRLFIHQRFILNFIFCTDLQTPCNLLWSRRNVDAVGQGLRPGLINEICYTIHIN